MRGIGFGRRCWSLGPTISMRMMYWRLVSIRRWKDIVLHHIEDVVCEAEERSRVDVDSEIVPKARAFSRTALIGASLQFSPNPWRWKGEKSSLRRIEREELRVSAEPFLSSSRSAGPRKVPRLLSVSIGTTRKGYEQTVQPLTGTQSSALPLLSTLLPWSLLPLQLTADAPR